MKKTMTKRLGLVKKREDMTHEAFTSQSSVSLSADTIGRC